MSESGIRKLAWPLEPGDVPNISGLVVDLSKEIEACESEAGGTVVLIESAVAGTDELIRFAERLAEHWENEGRTCVVVDAHPAAPFLGSLFKDTREGFCEMLLYGLSPEKVAVGREGATGMWIPAGAPWSAPLESPEEPERCVRLIAEQADRVLLLADGGDAEGFLAGLRDASQYRLVLDAAAGTTAAEPATADVAAEPPDAADGALNDLVDDGVGDTDDEMMFDGDAVAADQAPDVAEEPPAEAAPDDEPVEDAAPAAADGAEEPAEEPVLAEEPAAAEAPAEEPASLEETPIAEEAAEADPAPTLEPADAAAEADASEPDEALPPDLEIDEAHPPAAEEVMPFEVSVDGSEADPAEASEAEPETAAEDGAESEEEASLDEQLDEIDRTLAEVGEEEGPAEFDLDKIARARRRRIMIPFLGLCVILMAAGGYLYYDRFGLALPGAEENPSGTENMADVSTRLPERVDSPYHSGSADSSGSEASAGGEVARAGLHDDSPLLTGRDYEHTRKQIDRLQAEADAIEGIEIADRGEHDGRWLGEGARTSGESGETADDRSASTRQTEAPPAGAAPNRIVKPESKIVEKKQDMQTTSSEAEESRTRRVAALYLEDTPQSADASPRTPRRRLESRSTWRSALDHGGSFLVHVESYQDSALGAWNARRQGFAEIGYVLKPALINGSEWFRLCVGPFPTLEAATNFRDDQLDRAGRDYCTVMPYRRE